MPKRVRTHNGVYHPWDATVLGVDTATTSGWAVRVRGRLTASGECHTRNHPERVTAAAALAADHAARSGTPLVVCLERPFGGSVTVVMALGQARERWIRACADAGIGANRMCDVVPGTWRSGLFGAKWVRAQRDDIRAYEMRYALAQCAVDDLGPDEATAICISAWAARARMLGDRFKLRAVTQP